MAKPILWFSFIITFIAIVTQYHNGVHIETFTKVLFWSFLCVLAICESIEKGLKR